MKEMRRKGEGSYLNLVKKRPITCQEMQRTKVQLLVGFSFLIDEYLDHSLEFSILDKNVQKDINYNSNYNGTK